MLCICVSIQYSDSTIPYVTWCSSLQGTLWLIISVLITTRYTLNNYYLFHWTNLWIERKIFSVLHLLKRETSTFFGTLAPCSFRSSSKSSKCLTFVLLTLSSVLIVWYASWSGLSSLLSSHNLSHDSLIYKLSPHFSPFLSKCLMGISIWLS